MQKTKLMLLVLVAAVWIWAGDAQATTITFNGSTVVSDTYEGDVVGSAAVADVGAWSNDGSFYYGRPKGVVDDAVPPGPASGLQYASLGVAANEQLSVNLTLALGDVIKFDSMVYVTAGASAKSFPWQFVLFGGPDAAAANRLLDFYRNADGTWQSGSVTGTYAGPSSYAAEVWQHWVLDYTVGDASATLTIDGASASIPASHTNLVNSNGFLSFFVSSTPNPIYLDDVPSITAVPGDFDGDSDVDGADFVVWQTNFPKAEGGTLATGDADGDGDVDGADFVVWQTNFPTAPNAGVTSVSEPSSLMLLVVVGLPLIYTAARARSIAVVTG